METLPLTGGFLTIPLMLIGITCMAIGSALTRITGRRGRAFEDVEPVRLPVSWRATDVEASSSGSALR